MNIQINSILIYQTKLDKEFKIKQFWKVTKIEGNCIKLLLCDIKGNLINEGLISSIGQLYTDNFNNWKLKK